MIQYAKKALLVSAVAASLGANAEEKEYTSLQSFLKDSTVTGDFNLRYEDVENGDASSDGLTLRSRVGVKTPTYKGFSAFVETEDVRDVFGIDDEGALIADPEVTEIDQAFVQYQSAEFTAKVGRQVITHDRHRFIGHVGWRQDRQTFDAVRAIFKPVDKLNIDVSYVFKRNRIFAEVADADSNDVFINVSYQTPVGKAVGYYYALDDETEGLAFPESDSYGGIFSGSKAGFVYHVEYAGQTIDLDDGRSFDTDFYTLELGYKVGPVTFLVGQELLGSDDGEASFTTPLATLHKFNGWSDVTLLGVFNPVALPNGLEDTYISATAKLKGGITLLARYHEFDEDFGSDSYGDEIELLATKKFKNGYTIAAKYADFRDSGETDLFGDVDREILWLWVNYKF